MPGLAGDFKTPGNLSSHDLGGLAEGYIQLAGDSDTTGRHDHFLVNAAISAIGTDGALLLSGADAFLRLTGAEESATDVKVNALGRQFGLRASRNGVPFDDGKELANWIFKNLCDETNCGSQFKGLHWDGLPDK
jgi:hypothetical protein